MSRKYLYSTRLTNNCVIAPCHGNFRTEEQKMVRMLTLEFRSLHSMHNAKERRKGSLVFQNGSLRIMFFSRTILGRMSPK